MGTYMRLTTPSFSRWAYELVHRVGSGQGNYTARFFISVDNGRQTAFEESRKAVGELHQQHTPEFVLHSTLRYLGNQTDYVLSFTHAIYSLTESGTALNAGAVGLCHWAEQFHLVPVPKGPPEPSPETP